MDFEAGSGERFEVVFLRPALRAVSVFVWGACGALFAWLAWRDPTRGNEFGIGLAVTCGWLALYWARVPSTKAWIHGKGFDWVDTRFAALLIFPVRQARWPDVVAVDTREVASRYGSYVRSRLTLRMDDGGTRRFDVSSRDDGYGRFLDILAATTSGRPLETRGMGVEAATVRQALHGIRPGQLRTVGVMAIVAGALVLMAFLARR